MVAPLTPDPVPKQKSVDKQFVHKRPSAGAIVEASSNLYAAERRGKWSYLAKRKISLCSCASLPLLLRKNLPIFAMFCSLIL